MVKNFSVAGLKKIVASVQNLVAAWSENKSRSPKKSRGDQKFSRGMLGKQVARVKQLAATVKILVAAWSENQLWRSKNKSRGSKN